MQYWGITLKEKVTPKNVYFLSMLALGSATHQSFSFLSAGFVKFLSKFEHRCCHFEPYSAARLHFCDVIPFERWFPKRPLTTTLGYHIILSQTYSKLWNDSIEDSEVENHLEKHGSVAGSVHMGHMARSHGSVAGFSPCHQFWVRANDVT